MAWETFHRWKWNPERCAGYRSEVNREIYIVVEREWDK
jgi:hypothetical protein